MTSPHRPSTPASDAPADLRAQQAAEAHLIAVWEAEQALDYALEAHGDPEGDGEALPESPASAPWDGCDTCTVREVLHAAWPILHDDLVAQLRAAGHHAAADHLAATGPNPPTTTAQP